MNRVRPEARRGEESPSWAGGRYVDPDGYVLSYAPDHPFVNARGYVFEHRLVMEAHVGRPIAAGEIVHHINHIKGDNRLENLALMTRAEHSAHHRIEEAEAKRRAHKS